MQIEAINQASNVYQTNLENGGLEFFKSRSIAEDTVMAWKLGFAPSKYDFGPSPQEELKRYGLLNDKGRPRFFDRAMFPILNAESEVVSFGGRSMVNSPEVPKYLNGPETDVYHKSQMLYGMDKVKQQISEKTRLVDNAMILLTEGYLDVLQVWQAGYKNVVGSCGTAFTKEQMQFLADLSDNLSIMYDGDKAGRRESIKAAATSIHYGIFPQIIELPEGMDADDIARERGLDGIEELIEFSSFSLAEYISRNLQSREIPRLTKAIEFCVSAIAKCPIPLTRIKLIDDTAYYFGFQRSHVSEYVDIQVQKNQKSVIEC